MTEWVFVVGGNEGARKVDKLGIGFGSLRIERFACCLEIIDCCLSIFIDVGQVPFVGTYNLVSTFFKRFVRPG